jgi:hypothetical protein
MASTTQASAPSKPTKPSFTLRGLRLRLPHGRTLRPKLEPMSENTLSSVLTATKIAKAASEAAPVPGVKAVVGLLGTVLEGVHVRLIEVTTPLKLLILHSVSSEKQ